MWLGRYHTLAPFTRMASSKVYFKCTKVKQEAFKKTNQTVARDTLLAHPYFNETFKIHTDASAFQLGAVISQKCKPIAFYGRKINVAQQWHTFIERELLIIVETIKEFKTILLFIR